MALAAAQYTVAVMRHSLHRITLFATIKVGFGTILNPQYKKHLKDKNVQMTVLRIQDHI